MSLAALELNDQALLIQAEDGALHAEPGFARLTDEGIVTGEEARALAWREPQHVYNQYWCRLNQSQLPMRHRFARHHADIAFAQLRTLWQSAGSPDELIVLAPGSFSEAQLSLLLGLINALPCTTRAILDSAVAACLESQGDWVYVDVQMHEAVLTLCRARGARVEVAEQEVFPGFGMVQIQNALARHISNIMIDSYRFDPLHSSETEQGIYDEIPHWLTQMAWESDVSITLSSPHGEHPCVLQRGSVKALIAERMGGLSSFLQKWPKCPLKLSPATGLLGPLVDEFTGAEVLAQTAAPQACLSRHADILEQVDELSRMRSLERQDAPESNDPATGESVATHLLCADLALSLDRPVTIRLTDSGPAIAHADAADGNAAVVLRGNTLKALNATELLTLPDSCRPGDVVRLGDHDLRLIRVGER